MVIAKLSSGLGNQLYQYVIGRQISLLRNTPLKLDISFFKTQDLRNYKLYNYNINADIASNNEISKFKNIYTNRSLKAIINRRVQNFLPKYKKALYYEDGLYEFEPALLRTGSDVYVEGYWQHYKYYENINPVIFNELRLKESYPLGTQTLVSEIENDESSVSVHIRRGDYVTGTNHLMYALSKNYYSSAFLYISQHVKDPHYYFFSDDLNWIKDNFKINAPSVFVDLQKDYLELDLMSKCRHNIIANSTFSWWAAFLNRNSKKIVISPEKWVTNEEINRRIQIQMPSWVKL